MGLAHSTVIVSFWDHGVTAVLLGRCFTQWPQLLEQGPATMPSGARCDLRPFLPLCAKARRILRMYSKFSKHKGSCARESSTSLLSLLVHYHHITSYYIEFLV